MLNAAQKDLNKLFIELYYWCKTRKNEFDILSCDSLAIICLKIIAILVDDQRCTKIISTHLSVLFQEKNILNTEEELKRYFISAEKNLEDNLRGFSNLLNWVLENNILRRDPMTMLQKVPKVNKKILCNISQLSFALLAYFDLDDVFLLNLPKIPVVLFLTTISNFYDSKKIGNRVVARWLKERIKNHQLMNLYEALASDDDLKNLCNEGIEYNKELLVLLICIKVAKSEKVRLEEMPLLNKALNSVGMLGLEPLLRSGFLSLEDKCSKKSKTKKLSQDRMHKGLKIASGN